MFSSKSFIVSGLTFMSLIHFEFAFVHGIRDCEGLIGQQRCACKRVSLLGLNILANEAFCQRVWTQP